MSKPRRHPQVVFALYLNAAILFAILLALVSRGPSLMPSANAALAPAPIAGSGNLYLMPAQLLNNVWGCYVMDTDNQTLTCYSYDGNQLKLRSARSFRYDHLLGNYNTHPDPEEIKRLVEIEQNTRIHGLAKPGPATQEAPATGPGLNK